MRGNETTRRKGSRDRIATATAEMSRRCLSLGLRVSQLALAVAGSRWGAILAVDGMGQVG